MNATGTALEFVISCLFTAACLIAGIIYAETPERQPAPATARPIRLTAADFLAAPVFEDTTTLVLPEYPGLEQMNAREYWRHVFRQELADYWTAKNAAAARDSGRRIAQAIRSRREGAERAGLIAAIRAAYAAVTLEGEWDDLVAAISGVMGGAAA